MIDGTSSCTNWSRSSRKPKDHQLSKKKITISFSFPKNFFHTSVIIIELLAHQDVLFLLAPPWAGKFEGSLHWMARWRPSTVFQVIHTESNILLENYLLDMLDGGAQTGDLGNSSPDQIKCLSDLQRQTSNEENDLNDQLEEWQDVASDMMLLRYDKAEELMDELGTIVRRGDELQMRTLAKAVQLLTPHQTVDFLVSAAHLHSLVRAWGEKRDIADGVQ